MCCVNWRFRSFVQYIYNMCGPSGLGRYLVTQQPNGLNPGVTNIFLFVFFSFHFIFIFPANFKIKCKYAKFDQKYS